MIQDVIALEMIRKYRSVNRALNHSLVLHLQSARARSIEVWTRWNGESVSIIPIMRGVFQREFCLHRSIFVHSKEMKESPWENRKEQSIPDEIKFSYAFHDRFIQNVSSMPEYDLLWRELPSQQGNLKLINFIFNISVEEAIDSGRVLQMSEMIGRRITV